MSTTLDTSDDDIYSFSQQGTGSGLDTQPPTTSNNAWGGFMPPPTSGGTFSRAGGMISTASDPSIATRPMTSIGAAGFKDIEEDSAIPDHYGTSASRKTPASGLGAFAGSSTISQTRAPPLKKRSENSPEDMALEMERKINKFIEEAASCCARKDYMIALEKAKMAEKKERALVKFRETKNIQDQQNIDLRYSVQFTLARMFHANGMYTEALDTYNTVVRNKNFNQSGRLRVNMGNIYFEQKRYPMAIKMYRMALDQILPAHHKDIRNNIMKNIGIAFVKMGQYHDAIQNLEQIVDPKYNTDVQAAFNLLLCYYALGETDNMRRSFDLLLRAQIPGIAKDEDLDDEKNTLANDELRDYLKDKQRQHYELIFRAAKMIAEVIEDDWERGYDWVIEQLKSFCLKHEKCNLASEMEMAKALNYLKHKKFQQAIQALQAFEKKDKKLQARAATNLSYLYLLKSDLKNAEKYARLSVEHDKYNAKALVNLGNCLFLKGEYLKAKEIFTKALGAEPDCVQAMYNIGLVTKTPELAQYQESLHTFQRLHSIIPESIEAIYQIADVYRLLGDNDSAADWYNRLITRVPSDPTVLHTLGQIYAMEDESQSLNFFLESYRYYPINMEVTTWLGLYFVKHEVYEKALQYFQRAVQIQPNKVDWKMMVASCYRRIGSLPQAKKCYEEVHQKYPDNAEALKYLVQICQELGFAPEAKQYQEEYVKLEEKLKRQAKRAQESIQSRPESAQEDDTLSRHANQFQPSALSGNRSVVGPTSPNKMMESPKAREPARVINDRMIEKDDDELLQGIGDDYLDQLYSTNLH